jgi:hypothetical protein
VRDAKPETSAQPSSTLPMTTLKLVRDQTTPAPFMALTGLPSSRLILICSRPAAHAALPGLRILAIVGLRESGPDLGGGRPPAGDLEVGGDSDRQLS